MFFDPACMTDKLGCLLTTYGVTAQVTFKRVDSVASETAHPMYHERREVDKTYKTWTVAGVVEEEPRENRYGRGGGEIVADLCVDLYNAEATGGTESGQVYEPQYQDLIEFRGMTYEVTKVQDVNPSGTTGRMAIRVEGRKHR